VVEPGGRETDKSLSFFRSISLPVSSQRLDPMDEAGDENGDAREHLSDSCLAYGAAREIMQGE